MKKIPLLLLCAILIACSNDDAYKEIPDETNPPTTEDVVNFDLTAVPYETLSAYNFFKDNMADLQPQERVLPYDLITPLFTDYASKKRFVWMPEGVSANYITDYEALDFPNGAVLIKNFYYTNTLPDHTKRIIETRLIFKRNNAWEFADYIWNDDQTEAHLDLSGSTTNVAWIDDNGNEKSAHYRIPSATECVTCHKSNEEPTPIGPKPQNLNRVFTYGEENKNQLDKWVQMGYLESHPSTIETVIDWKDESQSLTKRVRSYLDINCAHCHSENAHCSYRPIRLAYHETTEDINLGICVPPDQFIVNGVDYIVNAGSAPRSMMYYRMNSVEEDVKMPLMGRTLIHQEAVALVEEWIESLEENCP